MKDNLMHGAAVQSGVDACLSRRRSRVQIPSAPPLLIRRLREGLALTQCELARRCGVGQSVISRAEAGFGITVSTLEKIAAGTGRTLIIEFGEREILDSGSASQEAKTGGLIPSPELQALLEKTRHRAMTSEEQEAQRRSWARGEAALGTDADEARERAAIREIKDAAKGKEKS